jgi:3-dehydroshikimate dehydratase
MASQGGSAKRHPPFGANCGLRLADPPAGRATKGGTTMFRAGLAAALLVSAWSLIALPCAVLAQQAASAEVLRVTRYADDASEGSLRYAIEQSNRTPGRYRIEIGAVGDPPHVIALTAPLPPIKGPVTIAGTAWPRTGNYIVLDGSGYIPDKGTETCPGAVAGQFGANVRTTTNPGLALVDTSGVDISGLSINHFCIGLLIHRSSGNVIHDNSIVANRGGAGVMLTGDDGAGNPTATTTLHNKVLRNVFDDNGDGLELTRGAAFNLVAGNVFRSGAANPEPSQGIEILLGHDNVVINNRFEGYSDGIQVNGGNRNYIAGNVFTRNTFGISLTGIGNIVAGNEIYENAIGIAVRPSMNGSMSHISKNSIYDNGVSDIRRCFVGGSCDPNLRTGGIVLGAAGPGDAAYQGRMGIGVVVDPDRLVRFCPAGAPKCAPAPNGALQPPVIDSVSRQGAVEGHFDGPAQSHFVVELFANHRPGDSEGATFVGGTVATSDAGGHGRFTARVKSIPPRGSITATLTSAEGATSEFSKAAAPAD